jgi:D-alanyl-D-alanine carboxypeptidase/D-alanyl-D-alanine-endopeptidase (penicillin-binding protein 4)
LSKIKIFIENNRIVVSGTLNKSTEKLTIGVVVNNSFRHLENMVRQVLLKNKISLNGQILLQDLPNNVTTVSIISKRFDNVGSKALQVSDNFIVDYLLSSFGSRYAAKDWRECGELLKQLATQQFGINLSQSTIVDGSGLSRYNLLSINQFDDFLSSLYNSPDFEKFLPMLATPNKEGTLKKRFNGMKIFANL